VSLPAGRQGYKVYQLLIAVFYGLPV